MKNYKIGRQDPNHFASGLMFYPNEHILNTEASLLNLET